MIYTKTVSKRIFNDNIIRAVDSVINATYFSEHGSEAKQYFERLEQYGNEYRTVFLKLPRQCGKTTYLKKLLDHFESSIGLGKFKLVVPRLVMKRELYDDDLRVETLHSFTSKYGNGYCIYPEVILYDEVSPNSKEKLYLGTKFTVGLYT